MGPEWNTIGNLFKTYVGIKRLKCWLELSHSQNSFEAWMESAILHAIAEMEFCELDF